MSAESSTRKTRNSVRNAANRFDRLLHFVFLTGFTGFFLDRINGVYGRSFQLPAGSRRYGDKRTGTLALFGFELGSFFALQFVIRRS